MWWLLLFYILINQISGQYTDYSLLQSIKLPKPLAGHYTILYNETIYVFGGVDIKLYPNLLWWRMDISDWNITLNENRTDIVSEPVGNWTQMTPPNPPNYGDTDFQNGGLLCDSSECGALIDNYFYVIFAQYMYKLDLSQNPPQFADPSSFNSFLSWMATEDDECVTNNGKDIYYISGEHYNAPFVFYRYNVTNDSHQQLASLPSSSPRDGAACSFNFDKTKIYAFGGYESDTIDWYTLESNEWTNNINDGSPIPFNGDNRWPKCIQNPFKPIIECSGGTYERFSYGPHDYNPNLYYFITTKNVFEEISIDGGIIRTGNTHIIYKIDDISVLYLIMGGFNEVTISSPATDTIYYAVRWGLDTKQPTTAKPTTAPTTAQPTEVTISPTTGEPTISPTTAQPTAITNNPSIIPTNMVSKAPSNMPSNNPSITPTTEATDDYYNKKNTFISITILLLSFCLLI